MSAARPFPARGRLYIAAVGLGGALALADTIRRLVEAPPEYGWLIVAGLTLVSGTFALKIPSTAATVYLLMNTWLMAVAMAIDMRARAVTLWRSNIVWLSANFLGGASIALLLTSNIRRLSLEVVLLAVPCLFILHLVLRTRTGHLREAERHVAEVDRLYLSTVEALAIAIESKDQVTHGHVRRVQTLSLAIAQELGVTDPLQLRAIEAGALLHDMGKVAIPDHILNKPGKLTPAEYELIKLHAPIGAEILAAVDFPYPVVPIVRHHHENWDGTGYPDGIAGSAIPVGARILSVVDCFDALTSDRPYRRAFSAEDAISMIESRSGSMYDPVVAAALIASNPAPATASTSGIPAVSVLIARANATLIPDAPPPHDGPRIADWTQLDLVWPFLSAASTHARAENDLAASTIATFLRALTPATTVCIGSVNIPRQRVEIVAVFGHGEQLLRRRTVVLGEGVSGWVAANRSAMVNSDPAIDFPDAIDQMTPRLVSALAVPIGSVGVLTLYTDCAEGFGASDLTIAEQSAVRLEAWLTATGPAHPQPDNTALGTLLAAVAAADGVGVLSVSSGRHAASADAAELATLVLPAIRLGDGVVATAPGEIVAVLPGCEPEAEPIILSRLQEVLDANGHSVDGFDVGFAVTPRDGATPAEALRTARAHRRPVMPTRREGVCLPVPVHAARLS